MPASVAQRLKRALVSIIFELARKYGIAAPINRDSPDNAVRAACKSVSKRAHPDKGGSVHDSQRLNAARTAWEHGLRAGDGCPAQDPAHPDGRDGRGPDGPELGVFETVAVVAPGGKGFRIAATAVLLTYSGISGLDEWDAFIAFVEQRLQTWKVLRWCATMEQSRQGNLHTHLMLQFKTTIDRLSRYFAFGSKQPNAGPNGNMGVDYCGEGFCRRKFQSSVDRGMFYVWADKIGTSRDRNGSPCVAGNYWPCWTDAQQTYQVLSRWPETLWKQRKLTHGRFEEYLFLTRDGVLPKKRNLDAVRSHEEEVEEAAGIAAAVDRVRSNPQLFQPFPRIPEADAWLRNLEIDALRYPILVVLGPSGVGKTEWAKSLFRNALELKVGGLQHFPEGMRAFCRKSHDGLVLDDVRDLAFVANHQDKLQGKYDAAVEFASTPGGTCAYRKYLFAVPTVVTINLSTLNLAMLDSHDWLGKSTNRVVVRFGFGEDA